jgi:hypothetical protein
MCVGLRNLCTNSNRNLGHGIPGLEDTCRVWDLPIVRRILTCTSYFVGTDPLILVMYIDDLFLTGVVGIISMCKADLAT